MDGEAVVGVADEDEAVGGAEKARATVGADAVGADGIASEGGALIGIDLDDINAVGLGGEPQVAVGIGCDVRDIGRLLLLPRAYIIYERPLHTRLASEPEAIASCIEDPEVILEIDIHAAAGALDGAENLLWSWHIAVLGDIASEDATVFEQEGETVAGIAAIGELGGEVEAVGLGLVGREDRHRLIGQNPEVFEIVDPCVVDMSRYSAGGEIVLSGRELDLAARIDEEAFCGLDEERLAVEFEDGEDIGGRRYEGIGQGERANLVSVVAVEPPRRGDPEEALGIAHKVVDLTV